MNHLMAVSNVTHIDPSAFFLMGIPDLEAAYVWISNPFSVFKIMGLLGNFTLLYVRDKEQTLPKPMYLLLSMLALTQIGTSTSVVPKYCDHMAVAKMSCGDITVNRMYGLVIAFVIIMLDLTLIVLSYGLFIRPVLRVSSKKAHQKSFSTCTAHIGVMKMSYRSLLFSTVTYQFGQGIAPHVHIILTKLYYLLLPMFNPIIYGDKTLEFHEKLQKYTCRM
ncbi:olfactory receptor 52K2-like [Dermochelys coriacea]|uniref:olfactory receptor 52K2-like n=1 Tax=Dermochelys coriacea TaxID=27794 RepID=UPI0018E8BBE1|nr:olfactory receptor 52K2-like [Dermochelys coriacea]